VPEITNLKLIFIRTLHQLSHKAPFSVGHAAGVIQMIVKLWQEAKVAPLKCFSIHAYPFKIILRRINKEALWPEQKIYIYS